MGEPPIKDTTIASPLAEIKRSRVKILEARSAYIRRELPTQDIAQRRGDRFRDAFVDSIESDSHAMADTLRGLLSALSIECVERGLTPSETAQFRAMNDPTECSPYVEQTHKFVGERRWRTFRAIAAARSSRRPPTPMRRVTVR